MNTSIASALSCGALVLAMVSPAHARPAKCLLAVSGETFIDGACDFQPLSDGTGSFQITGQNAKFFAYLYVTGAGQGTGFWNEEPGAGHAHSPLGLLLRDGACWQNDTVRLCAW